MTIELLFPAARTACCRKVNAITVHKGPLPETVNNPAVKAQIVSFFNNQ